MKLPALITNVLPLHDDEDDDDGYDGDDNYLMIVYKCKCMAPHLVSIEKTVSVSRPTCICRWLCIGRQNVGQPCNIKGPFSFITNVLSFAPTDSHAPPPHQPER